MHLNHSQTLLTFTRLAVYFWSSVKYPSDRKLKPMECNEEAGNNLPLFPFPPPSFRTLVHNSIRVYALPAKITIDSSMSASGRLHVSTHQECPGSCFRQPIQSPLQIHPCSQLSFSFLRGQAFAARVAVLSISCHLLSELNYAYRFLGHEHCG